MFSYTCSTFLCKQFASISHCSPAFPFHLPDRHCRCHGNSAEDHEFTVSTPKSCSSLQEHHCPAWSLTGEPPTLGLTQGLGSSGFASCCSRWCLSPGTPVGRSGCSWAGRVLPKCQSPRCDSFSPSFNSARRTAKSVLPARKPPPVVEITVPVQQVINHTLNSTHKSGCPAVLKFLWEQGRSTRWFVIQSSVALGDVKYFQVSKMAIWLFFSHTLCYLMQTNIFYPNNFLPKYCWHGT